MLKLIGGMLSVLIVFVFVGLINIFVALIAMLLWDNGPAAAFHWPTITLFQAWCLIMLLHVVKSNTEVEFK